MIYQKQTVYLDYLWHISGISDPMTFGGDTDYVKSRFYSDLFAAFAEVDGSL